MSFSGCRICGENVPAGQTCYCEDMLHRHSKSPSPIYAAALDAILQLLVVDPMLALHELDNIRKRGLCVHYSIHQSLDTLETWAVELIGQPREYWRDADVSDVLAFAS